MNYLSPREREVIEMRSRGMCNKEIAAVMGVTQSTVKCHYRTALAKMGHDAMRIAIYRNGEQYQKERRA